MMSYIPPLVYDKINNIHSDNSMYNISKQAIFGDFDRFSDKSDYVITGMTSVVIEIVPPKAKKDIEDYEQFSKEVKVFCEFIGNIYNDDNDTTSYYNQLIDILALKRKISLNNNKKFRIRRFFLLKFVSFLEKLYKYIMRKQLDKHTDLILLSNTTKDLINYAIKELKTKKEHLEGINRMDMVSIHPPEYGKNYYSYVIEKLSNKKINYAYLTKITTNIDIASLFNVLKNNYYTIVDYI